MLPRILARTSGELRCQQVHDGAVLVGRPHRAIPPQETRAGAFLAAKTVRAVEEPPDKPLETYRHFGQVAPERSHHPIDEAAADESLANRGLVWPLGPVSQKVTDGHGK